MIVVRELLHHDSHLLRQRDAARRACVHDDRGGHIRAPPSPARRGDLLSDGHRRAWLEHRAGRGRGRTRAEGVRRPERRRVHRDDGADQRLQRLLHPHDRRAPRAPRAGVPAADLRRGRDLRRRLRRALLQPLRILLHRGGARGRQMSAARDPTGVGRGEELLLPSRPPIRRGCSPSTTRTPSSSCPSSGPTRRGASSSRASTTSA